MDATIGEPTIDSSVKIAVVDDDRDVREWLQLTLSEAGFDVKLASNGLRLVSTLQVDRPDVILLDVMMSWIDGFELCRALKKNPEFCDIPVLFISGASLAYFVVMPTAFKWFLGFGGSAGGVDIQALPSAGDYLSLVMQFILAFGMTFLLPVLLLLLHRAGLVSRDQLAGARRYVIVGVVALAAIVTPPDPGSQIILAIPLLGLFEISLLLMRFQEGAAQRAKAAADAERETAAAE